MKLIKLSESAFPLQPSSKLVPTVDGGSVIENEVILGLTKREYFAGLIMSGAIFSLHESKAAHITDYESQAKHVVGMTDALISELENTRR